MHAYAFRPVGGAGGRGAAPALQRRGDASGTPVTCGDQDKALGRAGIDRGSRVVPSLIPAVLAGPGSPLPQGLKTGVGQFLGHDFARVRVHTDAQAADSAALVAARAYTVGNHVVFGSGQYAPHTRAGLRLLVHELTHVVQQGDASVGQGAELGVDPADHPSEHQADAVASAVMGERHGTAGPLDRVARRGTLGPVVQRQSVKEHIEPHYPTEEEQRDIEKILRRQRTKPPPGQAAPTRSGTPAQGPTVAEPAAEGRVLSGPEQEALASRLEGPLLTAVRRLGPGGPSAPVDKSMAFQAVTDARTAVYQRFGDYAPRTITLTQDEKVSAAERRKASQVLVTFAEASESAEALVRTLAATGCDACTAEFAGLEERSRDAVVDILAENLLRAHGEELRQAAVAHVGGSYKRAQDKVNIPLKSRWDVYATAVHELIHALTHPAFSAAFADEKNIIEGFTDYFTNEIVSDSKSDYAGVTADVSAVKRAMGGPFLFPVGSGAAEESLRLAYFAGRLDLIGWRPSGTAEREDVIRAGGAPEWSPDVARAHAETYRNQAVQAQAARTNVLGIGLFFGHRSKDDPTITVRYARILARTEPYARGQVMVEGQLLGAPFSDPKAFGASIGLAGEYQEPYFYAGGGVRFVGTAVGGGASDRIDLSPFAGAGIRAWQPIRIGAEGFVLLPLTGGRTEYGGGLTVGVEFK
jgi:hypothetical protein